MAVKKENHSRNIPNRLGAFGGVFTPSILTILGVIMFMRAGYVIGEAGIFQALLILLLAKTITALTSLSIAAVSTNTPVAGGGAYFLISRALGPEFGGAIGLSLFSAQAISVPFYILGFSEAVVRTVPELAGHFQTIAVVTTLILFGISYVGAKWAIKTQYVIMTVLGLSILAFMGGAATNFRSEVFLQNWTSGYTGSSVSFWVVFAIYFPAATGIMAGVNMSGDLKEPKRAIPLGTFAAVVAGFLVYLVQILLCGGAQTRSQLIETSFETLCSQALFGAGFLVVAGVFAATLSSALGSFLGAPRVLQAVARDRVIPPLSPFARGSRRGDEPRRALFLTLGITMIVIIWAGQDSKGGAFNVLAAVVTMFFLYTYGMVNLAAFVESFAGNPSFRPRFRYYHWLPAICGAAACVFTAFLINTVAALAAAVFVFILYSLLRRNVLEVRFGDARWGFIYSRLRYNLLKLAKTSASPKNWRPTILVLTGNPETRLTMAKYALQFGEERGLVILGRVLVGDLVEISHLREAAFNQLERFLRDNDFEALSAVVVAKSLEEGFTALLQGHPVGPLRPNLVLLGWSYEKERVESFVHYLNSIRLLGMSLILLWDKGMPEENANRRIDVWWRGRENGSLMLLMAHLLTLNWEWSGAKIRLLRLIQDEAGRNPAAEALRVLIDAARVNAEAEVLVSDVPFAEVLHRHSKDASLVMLGFNVPEEADAETFCNTFGNLLSELPTTLLVCSSGEADLLV
ncbi:MAG TPA: amino acid permease [Desulfobacteraceae bacterium]|nr:amino acid permease [Desulfobacteraceae bacterium]HPJ66498.1 amino acid permease [Desulfobacteraceae bacterium]HPQ28214.1 amino acid permease [Desulfobacteraceae bacterium]